MKFGKAVEDFLYVFLVWFGMGWFGLVWVGLFGLFLCFLSCLLFLEKSLL